MKQCKVVQIGNFPNHLQAGFCEEIANRVGQENFKFIQLHEMSAERSRLKWRKNGWNFSVLNTSLKEKLKQEYWRIAGEAEIVVSGERELDLFALRKSRNLVTFYMSERWWKPPLGMSRLLSPRFMVNAIRLRRLSRSGSLQLLPIGYYAYCDMRKLVGTCVPQRMWGYFPCCKSYPRTEPQGGKIKLLWAGRLLPWKRVDLIVKAIALLSKEGYHLELTVLGDGPEESYLKRLSGTLIGKSIQFQAPCSNLEVQRKMAESDIYLLPSSAQEGWGAVINEAMAAGSIVIASNGAGAARTLIRSGENGLIVLENSVTAWARQIREVVQNIEGFRELGQSGKREINSLWSPATAASRFLELCDADAQGRDQIDWRNGPLKKISPISQQQSGEQY